MLRDCRCRPERLPDRDPFLRRRSQDSRRERFVDLRAGGYLHEDQRCQPDPEVRAVCARPPLAQSWERIARIKVTTAGEKRRPDIETSEISRTISGPLTGCVRTPGMVGENSGRKQTPNPAATIIWIQSSRSL